MNEVQGMNPFELQRQQLIARNRARLLALGIPEAVSGLSKLAPKEAAPAKHKQPKPKKAEPAGPSRQSSRLRDQELIARGEVPPDVEPGSELALFIIDGECPRCGKGLSAGHARHLAACKGPPEPPTEEEIAAQAEAYKSQQKEKLRQLELGGLVDFSTGSSSSISLQAQQQEAAAAAAEEPPPKRQRGEVSAASEPAVVAAGGSADEEQQQQVGKGKKAAKEKKKGKPSAAAAAAAAAAGGDSSSGGGAFATFIVIGSTGNHYVVKLTDTKRSCTCMDHRIRRRDCKHIRLIWEQLGIADDPAAWQQAVARKVSELAAADASDVAMVQQSEARRAARQQKAAAAAAKG